MSKKLLIIIQIYQECIPFFTRLFHDNLHITVQSYTFNEPNIFKLKSDHHLKYTLKMFSQHLANTSCLMHGIAKRSGSEAENKWSLDRLRHNCHLLVPSSTKWLSNAQSMHTHGPFWLHIMEFKKIYITIWYECTWVCCFRASIDTIGVKM